MNAERLQAVKDRFKNIPQGWTVSESLKIIGQLKEDGTALIAEVEKLHKALEIILEEEGPNCDGYETLIHATARRALEESK